jgi:hypothetical protein
MAPGRKTEIRNEKKPKKMVRKSIKLRVHKTLKLRTITRKGTRAIGSKKEAQGWRAKREGRETVRERERERDSFKENSLEQEQTEAYS